MFKQLLVRDDLNHLLLSDVNKLVQHIAVEFPDVVKLKTIGTSWQERPLYMLEIDARDFLNKQAVYQHDLLNKPAILLTGAHHSRELISIQMPLYSVLKMLHGGIVHNDSHYIDLLAANKYYVVPVVNVDGLADIEEIFISTGKMTTRRKNMNPENSSDCPDE